MNGDIKWTLSIANLDQTIAKLTQVDRLIKSIQASNIGTNNFVNQTNTGTSGTQTSLRGGSGHGGGGDAATIAAVGGASLGARSGAREAIKDYGLALPEGLRESRNRPIVDPPDFSKGPAGGKVNINDMLKAMGRHTTTKKPFNWETGSPYALGMKMLDEIQGRIPPGSHTIPGLGEGRNKDVYTHGTGNFYSGLFNSGLSGTRSSRTLPGQTSPHGPFSSTDGFMASLKGDFGGGWAGIRAGLSTAGGGGGFGGLASAMSGAFGKMLPVIGVLTVGFVALTKVMKLLEEGIVAGSKAYQSAAQTGHSIKVNSNVESAFAALGISGKETEMMNSYAIRSRLGKGDDANVILNGAKSGQFGDQSALLNMAEEFKAAMNAGKIDAAMMAQSAKTTQMLSEGGMAVSREWKTMVVQLAAALAPVIRLLQLMAEYILKAINGFLALYNSIQQLVFKLFRIKLEDLSPDFKKQIIGGPAPMTTAFESMGLVFGNGASDHLKTIAANTGETVRILQAYGRGSKPVTEGGRPKHMPFDGMFLP